jgi:hypothetical protein
MLIGLETYTRVFVCTSEAQPVEIEKLLWSPASTWWHDPCAHSVDVRFPPVH